MEKKNFLRTPQASFNLFPLLFVFLLLSCEPEVVLENETTQADLTLTKSKDKADMLTTYKGPAISFYKGVAQALVTMNHEGEPQSIGLRFSERSLDNLPMHPDEVTLELPGQARGLAFDHIDVGWMPTGHFPPGIYDVPHFDMHFYLISPEEKMMINDDLKAEILPLAEFRPPFYIPTDGYEQYMGKHWINVTSPEFHGSDFTHTFIYGSYDGEFIFYEPMITWDFLMEKGSSQFPIGQPAAFQRTGYYYPTVYSINYDATKKEYTVLLEGMVLR